VRIVMWRQAQGVRDARLLTGGAPGGHLSPGFARVTSVTARASVAKRSATQALASNGAELCIVHRVA
jgi:hypothetical protein